MLGLCAPSVRVFNLLAVCGSLLGCAGAADYSGFSSHRKHAAAERGNIGCIHSEAGQGRSGRDFPRPTAKIAGKRY